ncbi:uncharacterized protein LOC118745494 [Rhagoletis pomonella]|uniref:uncharacterized protein LOC118745494 n=1 Tax=Rhagoletis pomonella TaxID=28610 RepID=UPI0017841B7A|nr:uncharacterized protein LOC118745494 [Rhagoletis pomonella]
MPPGEEEQGASGAPTNYVHSGVTPPKPMQHMTAQSYTVDSLAMRVPVPTLHGHSINNIESWFTRLEAYFSIIGFGKMNADQRDQAKFNIAVMHMDERLHEQTFEFIRNPPEKCQYDALRQAIFARFPTSPMARLEQLTSGIQLGDNKPSFLLTQLQRTDVTRDQQLIKDFWIQRLPVSARAVIAGVTIANPEMTVEQLASTADEIVDAVRVNSVDAVSSYEPQYPNLKKPQTTSLTSNNGTSLDDRVSQMERTLARIEKKLSSTNPNRSRSVTRRQDHSSSSHRSQFQQRNNEQQICWYHKKFNAQAKKCNSPCSFSQQCPKN